MPDDVSDIPRYGLKRKLNHKYPEKWTQGYMPKLNQLPALMGLILRYAVYFVWRLITGQPIVMDYLRTVTGKQIYGVPIGGIGAGTIGRGYRGEFCRFQLIPGMYQYNTVDANDFIVTIKDKTETIFQSTLSAYKKSSLNQWKSLINAEKCLYTGLYPRSWTEYDLSEYGIKLICRQISPVVPHNYEDSSLPCAVFVFDVQNISNEERNVTIAFTFKNGIGNKKVDRSSICSSKEFTYSDSEGVVLYHSINKMPCVYALSVKSQEGQNVSKCLGFNPTSDGGEPWKQLHDTGKFEKPSSNTAENVYGELAVGIAAQVKVAPSSTREIEMSLVWDMPVIHFRNKQKNYNKFYTSFFGSTNATLRIVDFVFKRYKNWEQKIFEHQSKVLDEKNLPDWYKSALFNETYFVSDGGTIWLALDDEEAAKLPNNDPRLKFGRFAYLEGHEYRMYNTYDVHFYASFALAMNWPLLQLVLQYDMRDCIFMEVKEKVTMLFDGMVVERKIKDSFPHDLGNPDEEPFLLPNAYPCHDVSEWRDLSTKFVLQVFRDYCFKDREEDGKIYNKYIDNYLEDMYDACKMILNKTLKFDVDGDGLIENGGAPDQTFDTWIMKGSSAYCGGLWLAALFAMVTMAEKLGKTVDKEKYENLLKRGKVAYEKKLWNGKNYRFDCSLKECHSVMADQLCGHWYLKCCGYNYEVFPQENVRSALNVIYQHNVMDFANGEKGAVNGFINQKADIFTIQSEEVWTGVTYALASHMLHEDMTKEAWQTAGGMYKFLANQIGMAFETPEAFKAKRYYRAVGYMRPLSIWSMQLAWEIREKKLRQPIIG